MTSGIKRIEASLPEESFALVVAASEKMGLTLRGFASMAVYQMAIRTLRSEKELLSGQQLELTPDELVNLRKILSDPYRNAERIADAHERAAKIPHRSVPVEDRL